MAPPQQIDGGSLCSGAVGVDAGCLQTRCPQLRQRSLRFVRRVRPGTRLEAAWGAALLSHAPCCSIGAEHQGVTFESAPSTLDVFKLLLLPPLLTLLLSPAQS